MSEFDQSFPAAQIARELGIQVSAEDVPKLVAALHRAFTTGYLDGAAMEREACAELVDKANTGRRLTTDYWAERLAAAIRARGAG